MMEIDPCPFCGNGDPMWGNDEEDTKTARFWLCCGECGAAGPSADNHQDAADLWNERA